MIKCIKSVLGILIGVIMSFSSVMGQSDVALQLGQANAALNDQKYDSALALYQDIEEKEYWSVDLFHNMALAYASSGRNALSILYYEKALKFTPNDGKLLSDLTVIQNRIPSLDEPIPPFFISRMWNYWTGFLSATVWAWISILMMGLIALFCVKYFPTPGFSRREYIIVALLSIACIKLMAAAYSRHQQVFHNQSSIVVQEGISLKKGADTASPDIESLPAGAKVTTQDQVGDWLMVKTALGDVGWVLARDVVQI